MHIRLSTKLRTYVPGSICCIWLQYALHTYVPTCTLMPFAVCVLSGFVSLDHDGEEELQEGHLPQLETCLQCRTDHVCYDEGGRLVLLVALYTYNG